MPKHLGHRHRLRSKDDRFIGVRARLQQQSARDRGTVTVYVNGRGGRVFGGNEDAANNRSSIVWADGRGSIDVPAFAGGSSRWDSVMTCVQGHFADFDVRVTDRRPQQGPYIMMMVGGRSSMLGYPDSVGGVAPYTGGVVQDAVGYVFSAGMRHDPRAVCQTTAHEIGHTLGLDHTYDCSDVMSYLGGCGDKSFQNKSMRCGEWDARGCSTGDPRQNSHQRLVSAVGRRSRGSDPSGPSPRPPTPTKPTPPADTQGPSIRVRSMGGNTFESESYFIVEFGVQDQSGLAAIELLWRTNGTTSVFRCGELPADRPIECGMIGSDYAFALLVGSGDRQFAIRVTDQAGNTSTTRWRGVSFTDSSGGWEDDGDDCS